MPDPITSTAAGNATAPAGIALYKLLAWVIGPILAATIVMFMAQPKTPREWFCAIISTVFCSVSLGAYIVTHYTHALTLPDEYAAQIIGGVYFLAGLPGWFLVRLLFYTQARLAGKDALEILSEVNHLRDAIPQPRRRVPPTIPPMDNEHD